MTRQTGRLYPAILALLITFILTLTACGGSNKESEKKIELFPVNLPLILDESEKELQLQAVERSFTLEFSNPVALYAATSPGKPARHPADTWFIDPGAQDDTAVFTELLPVYSQGYRAAFVEKGKDENLWFAFTVENGVADKVIWQLSDRPFSIDSKQWTDMPGLLESREFTPGRGEFVVDMGNLSPTQFSFYKDSLIDDLGANSGRVFPRQRVFYARAFALDRAGNILGDLDRGLEILYGNRVTYQPPVPTISIPFDLLSGEGVGELTFNGEFQNNLVSAEERIYNTENIALPWYFRPQGFPPQTDTIYLQISTNPLGVSNDGWRAPSGLVHEIVLTRGMALFDNLVDPYHAIAIPFAQFAVVPSEYYVRAVALSPGPQSGTVQATFSKTVKVACGLAESEYIIYPPPQPITPQLPNVRLIEYQPYDLEQPDWMYRYEVVRQPTYQEYTGSFLLSDDLVPGLTPGTVITLSPPSSSDDSWWSQAWDTVTDFFSSLTDFLASVTNWVATAYNDAKLGLIQFVASNLPLLPDEYRDELEQALTLAVDYGLASIGIPPELPNFDQLSGMGVDYLAATALQSTGIPDTEYTRDMVKDLGGGIEQSLSDAARSGGAPNPLNWDFVRQDPSALYRPAYALIELSNPYDEPTPAGMLSSRVFKDIVKADYMEGGVVTDDHIGTLVATFGGLLHYELFRPIDSLPIPRLLPGQTLTVPLYFMEYTGAAFPAHPHVLSRGDFLLMYNFLGDFTFYIGINFDLPPVYDYMQSHGLTREPHTDYYYSSTSKGAGFTRDPSTAYIP